MKSSMTESEFEVLARRAGLKLEPAQRAVLHAVHGQLEAMLDRLRSSPRDRAAEPAHIFVPGQG